MPLPVAVVPLAGGVVTSAFLVATDQLLPVPVQLGIAIPLFLALGVIGAWMMKKIDRLEREKQQTEDKLLDRVLPALTQAASSQDKASEAMIRMVDVAERMIGNTEKLIATLAVQDERRRRA